MSFISSIATFTTAQFTYNLFDDGIANVLGVTTLKHGTNPLCNVLIRLQGGNAQHEMHSIGSTENVTVDNDRYSYFYLFRENTLPFLGDFTTQYLAAAHSVLSGMNFTAKLISYTPGSSTIFSQRNILTRVATYFKNAICCICGLSCIFVSPTLRFRFTKVNSNQMEFDPNYTSEVLENSPAYRTKHVVHSWRLGLGGSLLTGLNSGWYERAKDNPIKILTGVVQIAAAAVISLLFANTILAHPYLAVAGAMFA